MAFDLSGLGVQYPNGVRGEETEDKIAEVVSDNHGVEIFHRNRGKQIKFVSVVYWTLESSYDNMSDRRKAAQETALDELDWSGYESPQSSLLNICGAQAFDGVEYQPVELYVQNKWQALFERLVTAIEHTEQ